jgi:hypothetical protein
MFHSINHSLREEELNTGARDALVGHSGISLRTDVKLIFLELSLPLFLF